MQVYVTHYVASSLSWCGFWGAESKVTSKPVSRVQTPLEAITYVVPCCLIICNEFMTS